MANLKKSIFLSLFVEALGLGLILILGLGYWFLANGWFWVDFLSILGLSSLIFHCILGLIFYCYNGFWWWWWLDDGGGWDLCLDLGHVGL